VADRGVLHVSVINVDSHKLIAALSEELKKESEIKPPEWISYVKSGSHNERPIEEKDFWYKRCASLMFNSYKRGNVGVRRLRRKYGGRVQHVVHRSHHRPAGGKIIRLALQQLEKAGLFEKQKTGRIITSKGRKLMDEISKKVEG